MCSPVRTTVQRLPVSMAMRFHLFSYRTQKLSSSAQRVLGWTRPGRVCRCRFPKSTQQTLCAFYFIVCRSVSLLKANRCRCSHCFIRYIQRLYKLFLLSGGSGNIIRASIAFFVRYNFCAPEESSVKEKTCSVLFSQRCRFGYPRRFRRNSIAVIIFRLVRRAIRCYNDIADFVGHF